MDSSRRVRQKSVHNPENDQKISSLNKRVEERSTENVDYVSISRETAICLFENGEKNKFFKFWNIAFKNRNTNLAGLELRLRIYFATIPLRKIPQDKKEYKKRLVDLKKYLEDGSGAHLASNTEFVPFFALPYVSDPQKHPIFKEILQKEWVKNLKSDFLREIKRMNEHENGGKELTSDDLSHLIYKLKQSIHKEETDQRVATNRDTKKRHPTVMPTKMRSGSAGPADRRSFSDDETRCDFDKMITVINDFVEVLEESCQKKTISPELLKQISKRLTNSSASIVGDGIPPSVERSQKALKNGRWHESNGASLGANQRFGDTSPPPPPIPFHSNQNEGPSKSESRGTAPSLKAKLIQPAVTAVAVGPSSGTIHYPQHLFTQNKAALFKKAESMGNIIPTDPPKARLTGAVNSNGVSAANDAKTADDSGNKLQFNKGNAGFPASATSPMNVAVANGRAANHPRPNDPAEYFGGEPDDTSSSTTNQPSVMKHLNFTKISNHLVMNPSSRSSALLLQAIRQQMTRTGGSLSVAAENLKIFAAKDILSLRNRKNSVVATILTEAELSADSKEELARLLNVFASFSLGQNYLLSFSQGKELLYELAVALRTRRVQHHAADHILAALQKLSIRSLVQKELVLCGLLEYLLQYLDINGTNSAELASATRTGGTSIMGHQPLHGGRSLLSNIGLENALCLFLNLSLNNVSQTTILRYRNQIVAIFSNLFGSHKIQLTASSLRYACNVLYCVLGMYARVRQTARELTDLETLLADRYEKAQNFETQCQLYAVLRILRGESSFERKKRSSVEDEDTVAEDYLEAEIDSTDSVLPTLTELFGEALLRKRFSVSPDEAVTIGTNGSVKAVSSNDALECCDVPGTVSSSHHHGIRPPSCGTNVAAVSRRKRQRQPTVMGITPNVPNTSNGGNATFRRFHQRSSTISNGGTMGRTTAPPQPSAPAGVRFAGRNKEADDERMSSMMSHATFVLENDRRKPLLATNGFADAVNALCNDPELRSKSNAVNNDLMISVIPEERSNTHPPSVCSPPPPEPFEKENAKPSPTEEQARKPTKSSTIRQTSQPRATKTAGLVNTRNSGMVVRHNTSNNTAEKATLVQSSSSTLPRRIRKKEPWHNGGGTNGINGGRAMDKESSTEEYMTIFASRPKVVRTPECSNKIEQELDDKHARLNAGLSQPSESDRGFYGE